MASLLRAVAPVFVRTDRGDLRVHAEARAASTELPRILAYDRVPNGVGLAEAVFTCLRPILAAMREIVETCSCDQGCPSCVGPVGSVGPYGKEVARRLLAALADAGKATAERVPRDLAPPIVESGREGTGAAHGSSVDAPRERVIDALGRTAAADARPDRREPTTLE